MPLTPIIAPPSITVPVPAPKQVATALTARTQVTVRVPQEVPVLIYKRQTSEVEAFRSPLQLFPLKRVYYGLNEDEAQRPVYALVEEEYSAGQVRRTRYVIEPPGLMAAYIFDPKPLPGSEWIVFKFGRANSYFDEYALYLFNRRTHQVRPVVDRWLNGRIATSPSGRFVSFTTSAYRHWIIGPAELWVHDIQTRENTRVDQGSRTIPHSDRWLPSASGTSVLPSLSQLGNELNYSVSGYREVPGQERKVGVPVSYVYDGVTAKKRRRLEGVDTSRPSPDGRWLLFGGPKDINRDYKTWEPEINYQLSLHQVGTAKRIPVRVPEEVLPGHPFMPIVYTYWLPDSRQFFSPLELHERDKSSEDAERSREWAVLKGTVIPSLKARQESRVSVQQVMTLRLTSKDFFPDIYFLAFLPSPAGGATRQALIVTKTYTGNTTDAQGNVHFSKRIYTLNALDLESGKLRQISTWNGVLGLSAVTTSGQFSNTAEY